MNLSSEKHTFHTFGDKTSKNSTLYTFNEEFHKKKSKYSLNKNKNKNIIPIKDSFASQKLNGYKKSNTDSRFAEYGGHQVKSPLTESLRKKPAIKDSFSRNKTSSHSRPYKTAKNKPIYEHIKQGASSSGSRQGSRRQKDRRLGESMFSFDSGQMVQPSKRSYSMSTQKMQRKYKPASGPNQSKKGRSDYQQYNPGMEYMDSSSQPSTLVQSNYWGKRVNKVPLIGHRSKSLNKKEKYQNRLAKTSTAQTPSTQNIPKRDSFRNRQQPGYTANVAMMNGAKAKYRNPQMEAMLGLNSSGSLNEKFSKNSVGSQPFSMGNLKLSGFSSPKNKRMHNNLSKKHPLAGSQQMVQTNFSKKKKAQEEESKLQMKGSMPNYSVQMKFVNVAGIESGKKKVCQDSVLINKFEINSETFYVFAVFDGHGNHGHWVSQYVKKNIISVIKHFIREAFKERGLKIKSVLQKTCYYLNLKIQKISDKFTKKWGSHTDPTTPRIEGGMDNFDADLSGSTCSLVMLHQNKIYSLSLGDSKAVLGTLHPGESSFRLMPYVISTEHKASSKSEQIRIRNAGGLLFPLKNKNGEEVGPIRIWDSGRKYPGLMVSRSFGDLVGKKCGVSGEPDIFEYNLTRSHRCLIVASDGFWDMHSDFEALSNLYSKQKGQMNDIQKMLVQTTKRTLQRWEQNFGNVHRDDVSIILVYFDHQ